MHDIPLIQYCTLLANKQNNGMCDTSIIPTPIVTAVNKERSTLRELLAKDKKIIIQSTKPRTSRLVEAFFQTECIETENVIIVNVGSVENQLAQPPRTIIVREKLSWPHRHPYLLAFFSSCGVATALFAGCAIVKKK